MFAELKYKYQNRNSKKNLKIRIDNLQETVNQLRRDTLGSRSGFITWGANNVKPQPDNSLDGRINDITRYLGIEYEGVKLTPKPKAAKKGKK